jgi:hypothetical protein
MVPTQTHPKVYLNSLIYLESSSRSKTSLTTGIINKKTVHRKSVSSRIIKKPQIKSNITSLVGNFINTKTLNDMSNRDESNVDSTEHEQRERLKLKLMGKIDFVNKTQTISDGSISPHLRSLYSRQAHLASPADLGNRNIPVSEYSSNKSIDPHSLNNVERPKRFIAQGLALTKSGYRNAKTDQELPAVP